MKCDVARRVVLAALAAFFLYLLYLCAEGSTLKKLKAEVTHPRSNETLYLKNLGDGVYFIGGEGVLYGTDMMALVEGEGNKNDAREIIIGDGITELGYQAMIDFEGLETLWLGRDMELANNGSLKGADALRYIFIPRGFKKCGRDFLYECGNCYVVTDGAAEDLPSFKNVSSDRIIASVDSYDALVAATAPDAELPEGLKRWWP